MRKWFDFHILIFLNILLCLFGCSSSRSSSIDYDEIRREAYNEGYQNGYYDGEEEMLDGFREQYKDGKIIFISNSTYEELEFFVEESNGFEYTPEVYIIEIMDYFEKNENNLNEDEKEAFKNVITYFYDADWLIRRIFYGFE